MPTLRLLRTALDVRPDRFRPFSALVRTIGIAVPIALGVAQHEILLGVLASLGALYAGLASYGNVHGVRLRRMALTTLVVALLTGIGSITRSSNVGTILAVACAGVVFSAYGATSARNSIVGILGTAILIIVSGLPDTRVGPLGDFLLVLVGGVLETAIVWAAGPFIPKSIERRAVGDAYASLGDYARYIGEPGATLVPSATPFHEARARLDEGAASDRGGEVERLSHMLRCAETIRATLVGYGRSVRKSKNDYASLSHAIADALDDLGAAVSEGRYNVLASMPIGTEIEPDVQRWVRLLSTTFEEAARPPAPGEAEATQERTSPASSGVFSIQVLRALTVTHSLRFGLALGVGTAIYRFAHIPLGYWIPLTITFLLRPDYATTLTKGFARFVGTFGGVAVASGVAYFLHPEPQLLCGLSVVGAWFAFALYEVSFTAYIGALTFYVVLGIAAQGKSENIVGLDRMGSTAAGVVVAVLATVLWPVWESGKLKGILRDAFRAQVAYGEDLVQLMHGEVVQCAEQSRQKARTLRVEAERLLESAQLEPKWSRKDSIQDLREWTESLNENAAVLLSLHAQALEQRAGRIPDDPDSRQELQRAISAARVFSG